MRVVMHEPASGKLRAQTQPPESRNPAQRGWLTGQPNPYRPDGRDWVPVSLRMANRRIQFRSAALQDLHRFANSDNPDPVAALPGGQRVWLMALDQCEVPGCHRHSDTLRFYR